MVIHKVFGKTFKFLFKPLHLYNSLQKWIQGNTLVFCRSGRINTIIPLAYLMGVIVNLDFQGAATMKSNINRALWVCMAKYYNRESNYLHMKNVMKTDTCWHIWKLPKHKFLRKNSIFYIIYLLGESTCNLIFSCCFSVKSGVQDNENGIAGLFLVLK